MKYSTKTGSLAKIRTPCLVASLKIARRVVRELGCQDTLDVAATDFADKPGQSQSVALPSSSPIRRVLIAGGADETLAADAYRKVVQAAARGLKGLRARTAVWTLTQTTVTDRDSHWKASLSLHALSTVLYGFDSHKSVDNGDPTLQLKTVFIYTDARSSANVRRAVAEGNALKSGLDMARDLGNQPPNVCNPNYLLRETRKLGRLAKVSVSSLDEKRMAELGMGAFLAVSQGSDTPGRMIIVKYTGGKRQDPPVVLVGKGITFDTGGISLKPPATMDEMKFDMCGAASVLGATRAAVEAKLPINLITIVAAAENMPSGKASRPGDIVTSHSGKTVEILNTDAEGRLVLCDALSYAERFKPKAIIDVATLTGAVIVALGSHASAVYSKHDDLADELVAAGEYTGDRAWRMPLWDEYQEVLKSNFADIPNIAGGGGGSIVAACFLSRFTESMRWAHMDIAGTAFQGGAHKGATGRPVALLFRYLVQQAGR
ncbi:MAG: leucyl aminopeptidase [Gammaproteobacteria bacterium]|nr:leucyl aminopeptidase [Gammaproteobacteria bacterium]